MATTPIYAGGARRSAAPTASPLAATGMAAIDYDEDLVKRLLGAFQSAGAAAATPVATTVASAAPSLSESIGSGANTFDFGNAMSGGDAGTPTGSISAGDISALSTGLSALGTLGQNSTLSQLGSVLGLGGAVAGAQTPGQAAGILGGAALSAAGVPGVGLAMNAINGNVPGMVNSALALANPTLAAVNALSSMLGGPNLGQAAAPAVSLGMGALSDVAQIGLGSLVNAFSTPNTAEQAAAIDVVDMGPTSLGTTVGQGISGTTDAMSGGFADFGGGYESAPSTDSGSSGAFGGGFGDGGW